MRGTDLKLADVGVRGRAGAGTRAEAEPGEIARIGRGFATVLRDFDRYRVTRNKVCWNHDSPGSRFMLKRAARVVMASACATHGFKFGAWLACWAAEALAEEIPFNKAARHRAGLDR